jgi:hypothetical protein
MSADYKLFTPPPPPHPHKYKLSKKKLSAPVLNKAPHHKIKRETNREAQTHSKFLWFVVPCIFKYSNKTPNQMQWSFVKCIAQSHRCCSTCFQHYYAHHQELFQTAVAASGFHINAEVDVFPAVVGLSTLANLPRLETRLPRHLYGNRRPNCSLKELLMMGMIMPKTCWAASMLLSNTFRTDCCIWLGVLFETHS